MFEFIIYFIFFTRNNFILFNFKQLQCIFFYLAHFFVGFKVNNLDHFVHSFIRIKI